MSERTYTQGRIADVITNATIQALDAPTLESAKTALRQWMQQGDKLSIQRLHHATYVYICTPDGEWTDIAAELCI